MNDERIEQLISKSRLEPAQLPDVVVVNFAGQLHFVGDAALVGANEQAIHFAITTMRAHLCMLHASGLGLRIGAHGLRDERLEQRAEQAAIADRREGVHEWCGGTLKQHILVDAEQMRTQARIDQMDLRRVAETTERCAAGSRQGGSRSCTSCAPGSVGSAVRVRAFH